MANLFPDSVYKSGSAEMSFSLYAANEEKQTLGAHHLKDLIMI